jgi:hypothetical protein
MSKFDHRKEPNMSDYERRFKAAMAELEALEVWPSSSNPPYARLLRYAGFSPLPPHYSSFWKVCLTQAVFFGIIWGVWMWFTQWSGEDLSSAEVLLSALSAGFFFGLSMAFYYAYGKRRYSLSRWENF